MGGHTSLALPLYRKALFSVSEEAEGWIWSLTLCLPIGIAIQPMAMRCASKVHNLQPRPRGENQSGVKGVGGLGGNLRVSLQPAVTTRGPVPCSPFSPQATQQSMSSWWAAHPHQHDDEQLTVSAFVTAKASWAAQVSITCHLLQVRAALRWARHGHLIMAAQIALS